MMQKKIRVALCTKNGGSVEVFHMFQLIFWFLFVLSGPVPLCCSAAHSNLLMSGGAQEKKLLSTHLREPRLRPRTLLCWSLTCICLLSLALVPGTT